MPSADALDAMSNIVGFFAVLCFAVPALYADKYGRMISRLGKAHPLFENKDLDKVRIDVAARLEKLRGEWSPWKGHMLIIATMLAGLSYAIELFKSAHYYLLWF